MCSVHHRDRTDHTGVFKHASKDQARSWLLRVVEQTQSIYRFQVDYEKTKRSA